MKRNRIFSIGALLVLAIVLAGCQITVSPTPNPVRAFEFATSWTVTDTGEFARCDNRVNVWEYSFHAENPNRVTSITETYVGTAPAGVTPRPEVRTIYPSSSNWHSGSDFVRVRHTFPSDDRFVPVSIDPDLENQAIIIVPDPVTPTEPNGRTQLSLEVEYDTGVRTSYSSPTWQIASYRNCN